MRDTLRQVSVIFQGADMRVVLVMLALALDLPAQESRSVYALDYPVRMSEGAGFDEMGKGEMVLWARGDSVFGTFRIVDPPRTRVDTLAGIVRGDSIRLTSQFSRGALAGGAHGTVMAVTVWTLMWTPDAISGYFVLSLTADLPEVRREIIGKRLGRP